MKKLFLWVAVVLVVLASLGLVIRGRYVLDLLMLEAAIQKNLPPGTPKADVIEFIQARKPVAWDDLGAHVKARMTGLAANLIYRKDVVLDFQFDPNGRLVSYSKKEYLTFL
jgi:hypothetical protein